MWVSKRKMPKATSSQWPILTQSREGFGPTLSISWKRTTSSTQPHPLWLGWLSVKFNVPKIQKGADRDWVISNVISVTAAALASSMIQAMSSTKHYARWCWSPPEAQTFGSAPHLTPLTPKMKTGGMWFTFPQLAAGANVTFLNPKPWS